MSSMVSARELEQALTEQTSFLIDTNVLIDLACNRTGFGYCASKLLGQLVEGEYWLYACPLSLKDAYYIARKAYDEASAREFIRDLLEIVECVPVNQEVARNAAYSTEPDYEDGIVRACAEAQRVDYVISRDKDAFDETAVRKADPALLASVLNNVADREHKRNGLDLDED